VDPTVYFAILAVGLLWNGVLLFIFARHRQLWTSANIMISNLAVGDIVSITANLPVFYFAHYHVQYFQMNEYVCTLYITLRLLIVAVSALSVVALSILRYIASRKSFSVNSHQSCELSTRIIIYVFIVWAPSIGLALSYSLGLKITAGKCFMYGDEYTAKMVGLLRAAILHNGRVHCSALRKDSRKHQVYSICNETNWTGPDPQEKCRCADCAYSRVPH
jgi:hypothetical protein